MGNAKAKSSPLVALVPVDRVQFHPRNIRRALGDLRELEASLWAEGVLQPLLLHRKGAVLEVIDGHRRLAAARLAGLRRVPAMVVDQLGDDEVLTKMLGTALTKQDISRDERRQALLTLTEEFGHSRAALAERFGVSVATIGNWMASPEERRRKAKRAAGPRIDVNRLTQVLDAWTERADVGLPPAAAHALLGELRALIPGGASVGSTAPTAERAVEGRAA